MQKIFVSSTFRDMHFERDVLHDTVLPTLNEFAKKYGESVSLCDLRWGVNTGNMDSNEASKKVLSVCLDEIDRCDPYMIVIIGDRYGWIPEDELIQEACLDKGGFVQDTFHISVTELEIKYGALRTKKAKSLFFFRELEGDAQGDYACESEHHRLLLNNLKNRITAQKGTNVITYKARWNPEKNILEGMDTFGALVVEHVEKLLREEWKDRENLSPYELDQYAQWEYLHQKSKQFSGRQLSLSACLDGLRDHSMLFIQGASGTGKTALLSRVGSLIKGQGAHVLPIYCGSSLLLGSVLDVVVYIVEYLEARYQVKQKVSGCPSPEEKQVGFEQWLSYMRAVLSWYGNNAEQELVILLDSLERLSMGERDQLIHSLSSLSGKVKAVFSSADDLGAVKGNAAVVRLSGLEDKEKFEIINKIMQYNGREIDTAVAEAIVKKKGSANPLYLDLLIQSLLSMNRSDFKAIVQSGDGIKAITSYQLQLIESAADTPEELCVDILDTVAERMGSDLPWHTTIYLAVSRHGLRERDLEELFRLNGLVWNSLEFSMFRKYLSTFFIERSDGRFDFSHSVIRNGFLKLCTDPQEGRRHILNRLKDLPDGDPVKTAEVMYHCLNADDKLYFVQYVTELWQKHREGAIGADVTLQSERSFFHDILLWDRGSWIKDVFRNRSRLTGDDNRFYFALIELFPVTSYGMTEALTVQADIFRVLEEVVLEDLGSQSDSWLLSHIYAVLSSTYFYLLRDDRDAELAEQYLDKEENLTTYLAGQTRTLSLVGELQMCRRKRIDLYLARGDEPKLKKAVQYGLEAISLSKQIIQEDSAEAVFGSLFTMYLEWYLQYRSLAEAYDKLGGEENWQKALETCAECMEVLKNIPPQLKVMGEHLGKECGMLSGRISLKLADKGQDRGAAPELTVFESALLSNIERYKNSRSEHDLGETAKSCREIASHYMKQEDQKCVYWLEQSLELEAYREMCDSTVKAEVLAGLSATYSLMGKWYKETGEYDRSLNACKQAIDSAKGQLEITHEAGIRIVVGLALGDMAEVLTEQNAVGHRPQIEETLAEAEEQIRAALKNLTASTHLRSLASIYRVRTDFYSKLARAEEEPSHYQKAISSCKEVIRISRGFAEDGAKDYGVSFLIVMYHQLAELYLRGYQKGLVVSCGDTERTAFFEEAYAQCRQGSELCEKEKDRLLEAVWLFLQADFYKTAAVFAGTLSRGRESWEYIQAADQLYDRLQSTRLTPETVAARLECLRIAVESPYGTRDEKLLFAYTMVGLVSGLRQYQIPVDFDPDEYTAVAQKFLHNK